MKHLVLVFLVCVLSGCATILRGGHDTVTINSLEPGSVIYVDNAPRGRDVAQLDLERGEEHHIRVSKPGCQDVMMPVNDRFDSISLLGILIDFGIISIPIDLISGAAWKISPKSYTVSPICPLSGQL